ncbi:extracellular solute-binding protein [Eremococcus coleocola]|uniref:ABC transporter, solute-binding protein n=1 Tax=Eremococcus coleocola ACS-139-V-Col8 TaxID=908337 RepID=E4KN78_9LACT|nr:extracellular solute-binding protein [Eremococcus coleocola]EFR31783.1 ABC transporter, solute-binding protein [Eremococcus coleocola ACS-139-V-Col8]
MNFKKSLATAALISSLVSGFNPAILNQNVQAAEGDKLVVYSNSLSDDREEWIAERAAKEGFNLEFVDGGGGEILNRLLAEKEAPQADITFGMDEASFADLAGQKMLVEFTPKWNENIPEEVNIGNGYYYPLVEQRIFLIYNPEFINGEDVPKNWQDLAANPNLEGKFMVPNELGGGTNQKAAMSTLLQYKDENGEYGISDEGWSELEAYLAKGYMPGEDEDKWQNFADGKIPIMYTSTSALPMNEEQYGFKAEIVNPEQGVITMREQIGIINKGDDKDYSEAERFVEWFGSDEIQAEWVPEFGSHPLNTVAYEKTTDRVKEIVEATKPMEVDWSFVSENIGSWVEKIKLELMPL